MAKSKEPARIAELLDPQPSGSPPSWARYLTAQGRVVPKPRPRATGFGGKIRMFTPAKAVKFERQVAKDAVKRCPKPLAGALQVAVVVYYKRAATNTTPYFVQRPDVDNLAKTLLDALNGVAYNDDAQIVDLRVQKCWSADEDKYEVFIQELS